MTILFRSRAIVFAAGMLIVAWLVCQCYIRLTARSLAAPEAPGPANGHRQQIGGGAGRLTATFWNVEWFPGQQPHASQAKQRAHVAAVVPVIERLGPDILGLEEVADRNAAQLLTDHLKGFKVDVCSEFLRDGAPSGQQEVLGSRLPVLQAGWENWHAGYDGLLPRRGFAFAAYRLPAGGGGSADGVVLVYGLHLNSNRTDDGGGAEKNISEREEAMRQLLAHQDATRTAFERSGTPVVLTLVAGDMNTSLDDPRFAGETTLRDLRLRGGFRWAWEGIPTEARLTLPAEGRYPSTCFDHIFYRASRQVHLVGCALEPTDHTASDHRPVTATFEW